MENASEQMVSEREDLVRTQIPNSEARNRVFEISVSNPFDALNDDSVVELQLEGEGTYQLEENNKEASGEDRMLEKGEGTKRSQPSLIPILQRPVIQEGNCSHGIEPIATTGTNPQAAGTIFLSKTNDMGSGIENSNMGIKDLELVRKRLSNSIPKEDPTTSCLD